MAARVVFLRSKSPAGVEPRIMKEATALVRAGYEVHAVLWDRTRSFAREESRDGIHVHRYRRLAPEGQPGLAWRLPFWWLHAARAASSLRPDIIHAIDFDTAWPARIARGLTGAKLVYDVFDFYSEMITADLPPALRRYLARAERRMVARADLVILPDARRAVQFQGVRPRRLIEVMNVPEDRPVAGEPSERFTVFYGGMIAKDRGLIDLVAACEATGAKLIVAGHGPDEAELLPYLETSGACRYLGTIPYEEVLKQTASCHAVAALYDPAVPNNRLAAPNKVYEAMMLRKPVLTNEGIALADLVRRAGVGAVATYGDRPSIRKALEALVLHPDLCAEMGLRGRRLFEERYRWEAQADRLVSAYRDLLGG